MSPSEIGTTPEDWFQRVHPDDRQPLSVEIDSARAEGTCEFELRYRLRHKDGTYRWMYSRGLVVRNDAGDAVRLTGTQADVTVETVTDRPSGLPNRLLLFDRLTQSILRARRYSTFQFALIVVDIGRPPGPAPKSRSGSDPVLNTAARRLETCLRSADPITELPENYLVARVEGDRLAVLVDGLGNLTDAKAIADRILAAMLEPFTLSGREIRLSPAVGIALSASAYAQADHALRDAETALHRARVLGGSHCEVFDVDALTSAQSDLELEAELEFAVQRGDFELVYQPIVSLTTMDIVGFEALVRWRHAVLGLISPLDFIPIAERTGLIVPLGRWILDEACLQLKTWHTNVADAHDVWVSVNVSGVQLREPDFVDHVSETLSRAELQPRSLVLELTEGVAMDNPVAATTVLMRLRAMGVRISIDDFGTGYSSLAYLRQLPVDALKIDQSFVRRMSNDKDTTTIITGILAMATELGLYVVAEGVEQEEELAALQALQCESAQGYWFAKPLQATNAETLLRSGPFTRADAQSHATHVEGHRAKGRMAWWAAIVARVPNELRMGIAVLAVLLSTGVGALVYGINRARTPIVPTRSASSATSNARTVRSISSESAGLASVTDPSPSSGAQPRSMPAPAPAAVAPPVPSPVQASFEMVHLHRIGKCRGRLVVSRTGIAFVPDKKDSDDAVTLRYDEFVQSVDAKELRITSTNRVYRFAVADTAKTTPDAQLTKIAGVIARSRVR